MHKGTQCLRAVCIAAEGVLWLIYSQKPRDSSLILGACCLGNVLLRRPNDVKRLITSLAQYRQAMSSELEKPSERLSDRRKWFPLGLGDGWTDSEGDDETPVPKKKRLSLSLKKPRSNATHLPCATSEKENAPDSEGDDKTPVPKKKRLSLSLASFLAPESRRPLHYQEHSPSR